MTLTVQGLVDWLRTQPPDTKYDYTNIHDCLIARYLRALGFPSAVVTPFSYRTSPEANFTPLDPTLNLISLGKDKAKNWTYRKALKSAEKYLS